MRQHLPTVLMVVSFGHALWQTTWPSFAVFAVAAMLAALRFAVSEAHSDTFMELREDLEAVRLKALYAGESAEVLRPKVEAFASRVDGVSALDKRLRHLEESVDNLKNAQRPAEKPRL